MKKIILLLLLSNCLFAQVGINTNTPTATIDINGDLRIRNIQKGLITDSILCVDANGLIHKIKYNIVYSTSYKLYSENYDSTTFIGNNISGLNSYSIGVGNNSSGDYNFNLGGLNYTAGYINSNFGNGNNSSGMISANYGFNNWNKSDQTNIYGNFNYSDTLVSNGIILGKEDSLLHESSYLIGFNLKSHTPEEYVFGRYNTYYTPSNTLSDRAITFAYGSSSIKKNFITALKNGKIGIGYDYFETTISGAMLQINGNINAKLPVYANHTIADADPNLKPGDFYKVSGNRGVFQKP